MKIGIICYFLLFYYSVSFASPGNDSLMAVLNQTVKDEQVYDNNKLKEIDNLKKLLNNNLTNDARRQYDINLKIYEEYKFYSYDSALTYAKRLENYAYNKIDSSLLIDAKLKIAFLLLSSGLFKETADSLSLIHIGNISPKLKAQYYTLAGRYYYDLATYDFDKQYSLEYDQKGGAFIDSALLYYEPSSFEYIYYKGLRFYKQSKTDSAALYFEKLMTTPGLANHQLALTASTLSSIYLQNKDTGTAIRLLAQAAIADIKSSIKETFAIFNLAELLYIKNDFANASLLIENAIANANTYGARQRKAQVSGILSLIERERINAVEAQNKLLVQYGIVATLLLIALITLIIIVRRQNIKLKEAKQIITEAHSRQQAINSKLDETIKKLEDANFKLENSNKQLESAINQLGESNKKLEEANRIKEECVSYFFTLDSEFFSKLEKVKSMLEKKYSENKTSDLKPIISSINLKEEKENLLQSFDKVFLRIYPKFIESFNTFFRPEDKVHIQGNGMLNSDLRIFALMRMGITDSEKIARILGYSVNTIYTYKTKFKNKSILPKEEFEDQLMNIKSD